MEFWSWGVVRLFLLILLLSASLLCVFRAPTYHLWLLAIIVTEFPFIPIFITLLLLISGFWSANKNLPGTIVGLIALILFLRPVIQAVIIGNRLGDDLNKAFNSAPTPGSVALSISGILGVSNYSEIQPERKTYARNGSVSLNLDFYPSSQKGRRPCILVIHGGSWKSGDNKQLPELNSLLARNGYHVAAMNYRLAPKFQHPSQLEDAVAAIGFIIENAGLLNVDTGKLVLLGRSAGAQIALLAAYSLKQLSIRGVINFYGPADMEWGYSKPSNPLVMNSRKVMEDYLGGKAGEVPAQYSSSSAINFVSPSTVPTLLIHGKNDVLVAYEHSLRLQKKLNEAHVKNFFLSLPWATHGFDYTINGPGGQLSTYAVLRFLKEVAD